MRRTPAEAQAAAARGHEQHHTDMAAFHQREADKYAAKAVQLEAAGKVSAAARQRKVADRNARKVAEHQAQLEK